MPLLSSAGISNRRPRTIQSSPRNSSDLESNLRSSKSKNKSTKQFSFVSWSHLHLQFLKWTLNNKQFIRQATVLIIFILIFFRIHYSFVPSSSSLSSSSLGKPFKKRKHANKFMKASSKNIIHPRTIGYYFDLTGAVIGFSKIINEVDKSDIYKISRQAFTNDIKAHELKSSKKYRDASLKYEGPFITKDCVQLYDWQLQHYPSCIKLHEVDILGVTSKNVTFLAHGNFRDVWSYTEYDGVNKLVLKTLRYKHEFTKRNMERHIRDAMSMERLTKSPNVVNIFGFCGNSGIFEFAPDGDMEKAILKDAGRRNTLSKSKMMKLAIQVSLAISDVHTIEKEPAIVHSDISPAQFIYIDGVYKLNDFNRCRYLRRNITSSGICGFLVGNNPGRRRSPEEYKYELETEKVDVFSMGHIFYSILTGELPFIGFKEKEVYQKVKKGELPELTDKLQQSTDPVYVALKTAMKMCYTYKADERPSATEVLNYLTTQYDLIYPGDNLIKS